MLTRRVVEGKNSPSSWMKDDFRRRLPSQTPPKWKTKPRIFDYRGGFSKRAKVILASLGLAFLIGVHIFLLRVMLSSSRRENPFDTAPSLPQKQPNYKARPTNSSLSAAFVSGSGLRKQPPRSLPIRNRTLQPLQELDWTQYTIRINTWRRPEQLLVSVDWHAQCPGVAQIQIVWCDPENDPPIELQEYDKVVVERHEENTLNERFNVLLPTPTLGILSIDDDVLRPCEAIDAGFFRWTQSPDRMVGFDARLHVENQDGSWQYGYMSTTEKANQYSMSLTRYCFVHRDYMDIYIKELPLTILDRVAANFNCEDVAMSFLISSLTNGKPSLLADTWAIKSMVKLYVEKKISGTHDHKSLRDECVNLFAQMLELKEGPKRLKAARLHNKKDYFFIAGDNITNPVERYPKSERLIALEETLQKWRKDVNQMQKEVHKLMSRAGIKAYQQGLVEKTDIWKQRFLS